jgi:uncharacterized protein (TIGR02246 family)
MQWNRGDADAYGARYRDDATFTNVNGMFHVSREEFDQRHDEIFRGALKGSTITLTPRKIRFIRPDVAALSRMREIARTLPHEDEAGDQKNDRDNRQELAHT